MQVLVCEVSEKGGIEGFAEHRRRSAGDAAGDVLQQFHIALCDQVADDVCVGGAVVLGELGLEKCARQRWGRGEGGQNQRSESDERAWGCDGEEAEAEDQMAKGRLCEGVAGEALQQGVEGGLRGWRVLPVDVSEEVLPECFHHAAPGKVA